uniref:Uncharacterized protein n=1 Tax=Anguilla anguilla TaxID=7936 RepID=A0A0E9ST40_ANGAN
MVCAQRLTGKLSRVYSMHVGREAGSESASSATLTKNKWV